MAGVKEPTNRSKARYIRLINHYEQSDRFASLVDAIEQLAAEHLVTSMELMQAAELASKELHWQLYAIQQGVMPAVPKPADEDDGEGGEETVQ